MDWLTFLSNLVDSIAWPAAFATVFFVYRKPILDLIDRVTNFRVGNVEAAFTDQKEAVVELTAPQYSPIQSGGTLEPGASQAPLRDSPSEAIEEAWSHLEKLLRSIAADNNLSHADTISFTYVMDFLTHRNLIKPAELDSVYGLYALRNLSVHPIYGDLDKEKAIDFAMMVNAIVTVLKMTSRSIGSGSSS